MYACQVHADCQVAVWDAPQPLDPCCDSRVGYLPMSRKYLDFMASYKKAHCAGVACPTPPLPGAEPACCANIGRCVAKRCVNACEDPTAHPPQGSVLDPGCGHTAASAEEPCDADAGAVNKAYAGGAPSPAYATLTKCCASLKMLAPTFAYGTLDEMNGAAATCDDVAARLANGCTPTKLTDLKRQLRGKKIPGCQLP